MKVILWSLAVPGEHTATFKENYVERFYAFNVFQFFGSDLVVLSRSFGSALEVLCLSFSSGRFGTSVKSSKRNFCKANFPIELQRERE